MLLEHHNSNHVFCLYNKPMIFSVTSISHPIVASAGVMVAYNLENQPK